MAIDYGLGVRQAAYDRYVAAEGQKAQAEAKAEADRKRRSRQKSRGLMSLAANAGLAFATGGASIPYSGMISQTLMGDDYEGSSMQSLSGLASAAYSGVSAMKGKAIQDMQSAHDAKMDKMYKSLDALPDTPEGQIAKQNMALQAIQAEDTFQKQLQQARNKPLWEFATSEREKVIGQSTGNPANAVSQPQQQAQLPAPKVTADVMPKNESLPDSAFEGYPQLPSSNYVAPKIPMGLDRDDESDEGYGAPAQPTYSPLGLMKKPQRYTF